MIKLLGLDSQDWECLDGCVRTFEPPQKYPGNPIAVSDHWSDGDRMTFYGSVLRRPDTGLWQMWYIALPERAWVAYAESDDGITWRKPALDVTMIGDRWTNLLFTGHPWGPTIIFDEQEERPEWRYKMVVGLLPSDQIGVHHSADGIHWSPAADNPVIAKPAGSPMSVHRRADGQYVLYHRPEGGRRVVGRSESPDFAVNAAVKPGGQVRVEVTDLAGEPLEGFDFERCVSITGDSTDHRVRWRGDGPAEQVTSQMIRLRVRAQDAKLYALSAGHATERAVYWRFRGPPSSSP